MCYAIDRNPPGRIMELEMKLNECEKGRMYYVKSVLVTEAIGRRLEALGVNEKTPVMILNRKGSGSVIIKVRGTRLALGRKIAEGIEMGRQQDE